MPEQAPTAAQERAQRVANALGGEPDPQPGEPGGPPLDDKGQTPNQQGGQTPPATPPSTPPWGDEFDAEKAWNTIQAQREDSRQLKAKVRDLEREKMSELDRIKAERDEARAEVQTLRSANLKTEVAAAKGLPAEAIEFLHGATKEELESSADKLMRLSGGASQQRTTPDFGAGARRNGGGNAEDDFNSVLRRSAGRPA